MTNHISSKGLVSLDVLVFKEGDYSIAFVPALNISSHSKVQETAISQLDSAVTLFFQHWQGKGQLADKLTQLGWERISAKKHFAPVKDRLTVTVPYSLMGKTYKKQSLKVPAFA